jgi:hypothetical protein
MYTNSRWLKDNNNNIIIKGVSKSGLEYLGLDLGAITDLMIDFDIQLMNKWNINTLRLPLRDSHWLSNELYREKVDNIITKYLVAGYYIIIDLHTQGNNQFQDKLIIKNSINNGLKFWIEISKIYKDNRIIYEIFNEPYGISPITWWYGDKDYYGYKTIIEEIRKNTNNICIIGGLDYAYQWNFLSYNSEIMDEMLKINNLVLSIHPYGYKGSPNNCGQDTLQIPTQIKYPNNNYIGDCSTGYAVPTVSKWEYGWFESFGYLFDRFPMLVTEFGLDKLDNCIQGGWYPTDLLEYLNNNTIGYIAWAWVQSRLSYPSLINNDYSPTGIAVEYPFGPACGVYENNYYGGPGKLVYDHYSNSRRLFIIDSIVDNHTIIIPLILISILIYIIYRIYCMIKYKIDPIIEDNDEKIIYNNSNIGIRKRSSSHMFV